MYSYNLPRSSSTYIFSFSSLAFSDTFFIPSPYLRSLRKKNHSEVRNSSTQKKLTSQCLMDWQGRQDDEAKISSLCSQILLYIVLLSLWSHLCWYFCMIRLDQTFPAYQPLRKISQWMHILEFFSGKFMNSFEWKWLKEFWISVGKMRTFCRCYMYLPLLLWKKLENSTEWWTHKINTVGIS